MSGSKIEIIRINQNNMGKYYEIITTDGQMLRVNAVSGTNLFATKWYWDIYILQCFFHTSWHLSKTEGEALIPDAIRANILNVWSITR